MNTWRDNLRGGHPFGNTIDCRNYEMPVLTEGVMHEHSVCDQALAVGGGNTKEIPLTQGQVALVDDGDYEELNKYKWQAQWNTKTCSFYATRRRRVGGKQWCI